MKCGEVFGQNRGTLGRVCPHFEHGGTWCVEHVGECLSQFGFVCGNEVGCTHGPCLRFDGSVGWGFKMPFEHVLVLCAWEPSEDATSTVVHYDDAHASWQGVGEEGIRVIVEGNVPCDQPRLMGCFHVVGDGMPPKGG